METEKLYYADPYLTAFTATVLGCEAGKGGYLVTLDRTAFYPEGAASRRTTAPWAALPSPTFTKRTASSSTPATGP